MFNADVAETHSGSGDGEVGGGGEVEGADTGSDRTAGEDNEGKVENEDEFAREVAISWRRDECFGAVEERLLRNGDLLSGVGTCGHAEAGSGNCRTPAGRDDEF